MDCYLSYLKGHQNDVNSLSTSGKLLASGSVDGTIRIWDTTTDKSIRRLTDQEFFPLKSIENVFLDDYNLYASTDTSLYYFDIRNPSKIIIQESLWKMNFPEEINQICGNQDILCLPLDSGWISLINYRTQEQILLYECHDNVSNLLNRYVQQLNLYQITI